MTDDSITLTTPVTPFADTGIIKTLLSPSLVAGTPAHYEVVVTNNGPASAHLDGCDRHFACWRHVHFGEHAGR